MSIAADFRCPADHPALDGHFPGNPIVPGAVLLDQAVALAEAQGGWQVIGVRKARFKTPLPPDTICRMELTKGPNGTLNLTCHRDQHIIMTAILVCAGQESKQ